MTDATRNEEPMIMVLGTKSEVSKVFSSNSEPTQYFFAVVVQVTLEDDEQLSTTIFFLSDDYEKIMSAKADVESSSNIFSSQFLCVKRPSLFEEFEGEVLYCVDYR